MKHLILFLSLTAVVGCSSKPEVTKVDLRERVINQLVDQCTLMDRVHTVTLNLNGQLKSVACEKG